MISMCYKLGANVRRRLTSPTLFYLVCLLLLNLAVRASNSAIKYSGLNTVLTQRGEVRAGAKGSFNTTGYTLRMAFDGQPTFHRNQQVASMPSDGVSSYVYCLASDGLGNLYVGGVFSHAGGIVTNSIAKWNGKAWSALGKGITFKGRLEGNVKALALDKQGNLYAGGSFDQAGEAPASNVAKWNGTSWSALGSGISGNVYTFALDKNDILYVGGDNLNAGNGAIGIVKWDGSTWGAVGTFIRCDANAMGIDNNNNLYVGFALRAREKGKELGYVGKWNGSEWQPLALPGPDNSIGALALDSAGNVYVGGYMKNAAGKLGHIAKWDGAAWSTLTPDIGPATIASIAISGKGEIYVGGSLRKEDGTAVNAIAKWNGQSWVALDKPIPAQVSTILFDKAGTMYAGGTFYRKDNGGGPGNFIAKWNGTKWSPLETLTARPLPPALPKASGAKPKKK